MNENVRLAEGATDGVARLELNRPERRNALDLALVAELSERLAALDADPEVRVVALAGAGADFCAGADLNEVRRSMEAGIASSLGEADRLGDLFLQIRRMAKPVVAVVHGRALAGGFGLATACDLVLASEGATFGYPEVKIGFVPAMVMAILRRSVGEIRAFELIALGETIGAHAAAEMGLVNRVFDEDEFGAGVEEFLASLAARSATAVALSKRLLYQIDGVGFEAAIRAGAEVNAIARQTDDCRRGVEGFLKRS